MVGYYLQTFPPVHCIVICGLVWTFTRYFSFSYFFVRGLHCQTDVGSTHGNCLSLIYEKAFSLLLNIATFEYTVYYIINVALYYTYVDWKYYLWLPQYFCCCKLLLSMFAGILLNYWIFLNKSRSLDVFLAANINVKLSVVLVIFIHSNISYTRLYSS